MQLLPLASLTRTDWQLLTALYRDPDLAALNAAEPLHSPHWLLRLMLQAGQGREQVSFGVMAGGQLIGNAELYDWGPAGNGLTVQAPGRATLGIMLAPAFQGQGYGGDALNALLAWAFGAAGETALPAPNPPLERVRLTTLAGNHRALAAFTRAGFAEKGRYTAGQHEEVNMELTRAAWLAQHALHPIPNNSQSVTSEAL